MLRLMIIRLELLLGQLVFGNLKCKARGVTIFFMEGRVTIHSLVVLEMISYMVVASVKQSGGIALTRVTKLSTAETKRATQYRID